MGLMERVGEREGEIVVEIVGEWVEEVVEEVERDCEAEALLLGVREDLEDWEGDPEDEMLRDGEELVEGERVAAMVELGGAVREVE